MSKTSRTSELKVSSFVLKSGSYPTLTSNPNFAIAFSTVSSSIDAFNRAWRGNSLVFLTLEYSVDTLFDSKPRASSFLLPRQEYAVFDFRCRSTVVFQGKVIERKVTEPKDKASGQFTIANC